MVFIRKFRSFVVKHDRKILVVFTASFVIIGPHFGGSLVGDVLDKVLFASTLVANGRILEIF